jgi:hypothetical protein
MKVWKSRMAERPAGLGIASFAAMSEKARRKEFGKPCWRIALRTL